MNHHQLETRILQSIELKPIKIEIGQSEPAQNPKHKRGTIFMSQQMKYRLLQLLLQSRSNSFTPSPTKNRSVIFVVFLNFMWQHREKERRKRDEELKKREEERRKRHAEREKKERQAVLEKELADMEQQLNINACVGNEQRDRFTMTWFFCVRSQQ